MRFVLSRAEERDVDQLVWLAFRTFTGDMMTIFFGHPEHASYAYTKRVFLSFFQDPADTLLKIEDVDSEVDVDIIDQQTGESKGTERRKRIVCVADWKIFPNYVPDKPMFGKLIAEGGHELTGADMSYLPDPQEASDAASIMNLYLERRRRQQQEAHMHLFLLFADPNYQRKGLGKAMVRWGNGVADAMMLPIWLEGSEEGQGLYQQHGYVAKEPVKIQREKLTGEYLVMRRPPPVLSIEGLHPKPGSNKERDEIIQEDKTGMHDGRRACPSGRVV